MYWYILICTDIYWYVLIYIDMYWYILICTDIYWYVQIYWYVLINIDMNRVKLICNNKYWCAHIYIDVHTPFLTFFPLNWYTKTPPLSQGGRVLFEAHGGAALDESEAGCEDFGECAWRVPFWFESVEGCWVWWAEGRRRRLWRREGEHWWVESYRTSFKILWHVLGVSFLNIYA